MRILAACGSCHCQYDVSDQKANSVVRCRCGAGIIVPEPRVRDTRLVRCASCGAVRGSGGDNCEFCDARLSSIDKGWGTMCPGCFCRLPNDVQFCVECGLKISVQKLEALRTDLNCPRCSCSLQGRQLERIELFECARCAGLWLPVASFETICDNKEVMQRMSAASLMASTGRKKFELDMNEEVKYIPCPGCKNLMNRKNFGHISGVIIDTCKDDGIWLDNQELNRIIKFIEAGGLAKGREFDARNSQHSEKMQTKTFVPSLPLDLPDKQTRHVDIGPFLGRIVAEIAAAFFR